MGKLKLHRINYRVHRGTGPSRQTQGGKLVLKGDWEDRVFHEKIDAAIRGKNPGWLVTGYATTTPDD